MACVWWGSVVVTFVVMVVEQSAAHPHQRTGHKECLREQVLGSSGVNELRQMCAGNPLSTTVLNSIPFTSLCDLDKQALTSQGTAGDELVNKCCRSVVSVPCTEAEWRIVLRIRYIDVICFHTDKCSRGR